MAIAKKQGRKNGAQQIQTERVIVVVLVVQKQVVFAVVVVVVAVPFVVNGQEVLGRKSRNMFKAIDPGQPLVPSTNSMPAFIMGILATPQSYPL